jgi:hypothetical protein
MAWLGTARQGLTWLRMESRGRCGNGSTIVLLMLGRVHRVFDLSFGFTITTLERADFCASADVMLSNVWSTWRLMKSSSPRLPDPGLTVHPGSCVGLDLQPQPQRKPMPCATLRRELLRGSSAITIYLLCVKYVTVVNDSF